MPAAEIAARVREALKSVKTADLKDAQLIEVLRLAQQLTDTMQMFFGAIDRSIHDEFNAIAAYIARTRDEIAQLRPNDIRQERIPVAGAELEAVVGETARATDVIMSEAEAVMALQADDAGAYKAQVDAAMTRIIEACAFQDLAGQRVSKVVTSLRHIEQRVARFAATMGVQDADASADERAETDRRRSLHLHGPALGGPETGQGDVDALMALDQSAIDALFD